MLWLGSLVRWWRDRHRRIFRFTVGDEVRWADPIRVFAAVEDACPNLGEMLDTLQAGTPTLPGGVGADVKKQRADAKAEVIRVARLVFGLPEFAGDDLPPGVARSRRHVSDEEAIALIVGFLRWLADAGEAARPTVS